MRVLLLALVFVVLAHLTHVNLEVIRADHNGPVLPGVPTTVINRVMDRGHLTYRLDSATSNYPSFREQASQVAQAGIGLVGVDAVEIFEGIPDVWLTMPNDSIQVENCGQGAAACVTYTTDPIIVMFRRALLYIDWKSTISHEGINYGHVMGEHEQYYDRTFVCKSLADLIRLGPGPTVMSCGTGLWLPQEFDIKTVHSVIVPRPVDGAALSRDSQSVFYAATDRRARRIAVFFETYAGYIYWSGGYVTPCYTSGVFVCGVSRIIDPGFCQGVLLGAENATRATWGRNLVLAGWSNCFP